MRTISDESSTELGPFASSDEEGRYKNSYSSHLKLIKSNKICLDMTKASISMLKCYLITNTKCKNAKTSRMGRNAREDIGSLKSKWHFECNAVNVRCATAGKY